MYFLSSKAGCNRLRRSPQSLSIRWSDFKILHGCEHAIQQRSTVLHIPTTPSSNSDTIQLFFILFLTSGVAIIQSTPWFFHSTVLNNLCPRFQLSVSSAASFVPVRSCDDQLLPTVCKLRNQIVAGTLLVLACHLSTRSAGVSYSLVPSSWL